MLVNYFLLLQNALGVRRVAFWGHGKNFQSRKMDRFSEWVKRVLSTRVHWWFAYNDLSAEVVTSLGYPQARITVVQNAIDTAGLLRELAKLKPEDTEQVGREIGVRGEHIGLYVGGMYLEKRLEFLLESIILHKRTGSGL